jgi:hypothetical protein
MRSAPGARRVVPRDCRRAIGVKYAVTDGVADANSYANSICDAERYSDRDPECDVKRDAERDADSKRDAERDAVAICDPQRTERVRSWRHE